MSSSELTSHLPRPVVLSHLHFTSFELRCRDDCVHPSNTVLTRCFHRYISKSADEYSIGTTKECPQRSSTELRDV